MSKAKKNTAHQKSTALAQNNTHLQIMHLWQKISQDSDNIVAWKELRFLLKNVPNYDLYATQVIACINCHHMDADYLIREILIYLYQKTYDDPKVIDPILLALMKKVVIPNYLFEVCFHNIRKQALIECINSNFSSFNPEYIEALSLQCFLNEHAYPCTQSELKQISDLLMTNLKRCLIIKILDQKTRYILMLASCYFPIFNIFTQNKGLLELCRQYNFSPAILKMQVENILQEQKIKEEIVALSIIEDDVSKAVQQQYEKYPYPRWHSAEIILPQHHLYNLINLHPDAIPIKLENAKMLIAGCGTGKHLLNSQNPQFKITAIDLSRASLAYAIRNSLEYGLSNVKFYQADILNLENLKEEFDIIESCGVLHHTRSIDESFGELYKKLKKHGFFFVALYSTTARAYLTKFREIIKERGYKPELTDIRNLRETVMANLHNDVNRAILQLNDFYTSSMLIDLLFHCNEITVDLVYIKALLAKYNMKFICFNGLDRNIEIYEKYAARFPEDKNKNNLDNWQQFEADNTDTFIGMYQFILQKM